MTADRIAQVTPQQWLTRLTGGLFVLLSLAGVWSILTYGVDVPFWDEWEYLRANEFPAGFRWAWLWEQHNEHRIVTTKLWTLAFLHLTNWNLVGMQIANFLVYLLGVASFIPLGRRLVPTVPAWVWGAFALFLLSPRVHENHLWAFQSQFHFVWMFTGLAAALIFTAQPSCRRTLLGALAATLAALSLSGGVVAIVALMTCYSVFRVGRAWSGPKSGRWRELGDLGLFVLPTLAVIALWLSDYVKPAGHPPVTLPHEAAFWAYFVNIVSHGFGFDSTSLTIGAACTALVAAPLLLLILRDRGRFDPAMATLVAMVAAATAVLASITMGRAGFGQLGQAKSSRYAELAGLLLPLCALAWALVLADKPRLRAGALTGLWLLCLAAFVPSWNYVAHGQGEQARRLAGVACAKDYYEGRKPDGNCPTIYPAPIPERLDAARSLNLSFYRHLSRQ